uniref:6-phosphogluconolactonase-like n=1 Tax=Styela clava TaxID=7725 RepID=UPI00193A2A99|nr:6-phosphogluconolactonase-like [Styela clava]
MAGEPEANTHILEPNEIGPFVSECIVKEAQKSISERGIFTLGVSGGSIVNILSETLAKKNNVDWGKWRIFFCDERHVPFTDPESTFTQYKNKVIDVVGYESSWIVIDPNLTVEKCAADYQTKIQNVFKCETEFPKFDMLLLGMGPDGHTCSLFPEHKLLEEKDLIIAPISDSPKPPPKRVTMTLPVLNNARNVIFISAGASKAETIKKVFDKSSKLPASLVKPTDGILRWVMDKAAASLL